MEVQSDCILMELTQLFQCCKDSANSCRTEVFFNQVSLFKSMRELYAVSTLSTTSFAITYNDINTRRLLQLAGHFSLENSRVHPFNENHTKVS